MGEKYTQSLNNLFIIVSGGKKNLIQGQAVTASGLRHGGDSGRSPPGRKQDPAVVLLKFGDDHETPPPLVK